MTGDFTERGNLKTDRYLGERHVNMKIAIYKLRRVAWNISFPHSPEDITNILIWDS